MYKTTKVNGKSPGEGAMTEEGFKGWILDLHGSVPVPQTAGRVCKVYAEHVRFKVTAKQPEEIPTGRGRWKVFTLERAWARDTLLTIRREWWSGREDRKVQREKKVGKEKREGPQRWHFKREEEKLPLTQQRKASRQWARATTPQELNESSANIASMLRKEVEKMNGYQRCQTESQTAATTKNGSQKSLCSGDRYWSTGVASLAHIWSPVS